MTFFQIAMLVITIIILSIGQILFKIAAETLNFSANGFIPSLFNLKLIFAIFIYGLATISWLYVLKHTPLRIAYPFMALAFLIVPCLSHLLLKEAISWHTYAGGIIIVSGVLLSIS